MKKLNQIGLMDVVIEKIITHYIGSKVEEEGIRFSNSILFSDADTKNVFKQYFLSPFKTEGFYHMDKESNVFALISSVFNDKNTFNEKSVNLASHLYNQSEHPKIKPGEFYMVYFNDVNINGEIVDAIGLFKSETKDTFLKVRSFHGGFAISPEQGINISKLDKGCLIYNVAAEDGYLVSVVNNSGKGLEAQYWNDSFLSLKPCCDDYFQTRNYLELCKQFVVEHAPKTFEVTKTDQVDFLNKSLNFFKSNEEFNINEFTEEVICQPNLTESFKEYKKQYEAEREVNLNDEFSISLPAVKSQTKAFKNVIKLDKNFHIYVHGKRELIEKGFDEETGMNYYKLFYNEED